ncbi:hypothetical protein U472_13280 [Orenia metallireducens]|jgi:hypothetical protein|uniref:Uncharacterized protein n=2 Tax=Orenia metallireducens TaxID=1413210 RepID=A0A1C0A5B0_9FIRM|nr:hypothetical protein U472_13280 [Orenia metallireducens]
MQLNNDYKKGTTLFVPFYKLYVLVKNYQRQFTKMLSRIRSLIMKINQKEIGKLVMKEIFYEDDDKYKLMRLLRYILEELGYQPNEDGLIKMQEDLKMSYKD